ncbi:hypothetical protein O181_057674 [Austropuccinia psidii MF-1]|uniref:RNA helicase n=1 Tax=Austropuccinia psidii MF-1 TaxID=1389203 RepID=A0A9Q3HWW6_9BASI|nr:hypothetical protein [Austropuccinia psidii MF-1]
MKKSNEDGDLDFMKDSNQGSLEEDQEFFNLTTTQSNHQYLKKSSKKNHGSFQSFGLHPSLLRAIVLRGFSTPTPIQRAVLPIILASPPRDVVGMARTGSGKTLAYLIPLIHSLRGTHSIQFGPRALIVLPTRELALQVLKVAIDLSKGFHQSTNSKNLKNVDKDTQRIRNEALRWALIVGGDSLEDQFSILASNPDVIIATPGRLLHLLVEMNLDLKSINYLVFDEADRLFEMGFAHQLQETLLRLPPNRQTLLFSATLPKTLVDFAKAGLQNPKLVRLDSESKISSELQMAFLNVKPMDKEASLLVIIQDIIRIPKSQHIDQSNSHQTQANSSSSSHQTIIFTATKHHVEYLTGILTTAGYLVSFIYGSLDQIARRNQLGDFRAGRTNILVVTDLAARGIDIPILENVINYDFSSSARAFVHRVGRTARAGRQGWAYSLVTRADLPYLLDLQLFLSRPLLACPISLNSTQTPDFSSNLIIGSIPRDRLDAENEYVRETLILPNSSLLAISTVVKRAQKMYEKSQSAASTESYRRAKALISSSQLFGEMGCEESTIHLIFQIKQSTNIATEPIQNSKIDKVSSDNLLRGQLLAQVNQFTPHETVFEIGTRGKSPAAQLMRERRKSMGQAIQKKRNQSTTSETSKAGSRVTEDEIQGNKLTLAAATEGELEEAFEMPYKRQKKLGPQSFKDQNVYLGYEQAGAAAERGFKLNEGTSAAFAMEANTAAFELGIDDEGRAQSLSAQKASQVRWDRKTKKFIKSGQVGRDNVKLIKTENGAKLPASYKSGAFEEWKSKQKIKLPNIGEEELKGRRMSHHSLKFRHKGDHQQAGKQDERKSKVFKKTIDGQKKFLGPTHSVTRGGKHQPSGKGKGKGGNLSKIKNGGLNTVNQIQRARSLKEKRQNRSNRPSNHHKRRN